MIDSISQRGARGHLIMIADPVEETFPFAGHVEFSTSIRRARLRVGEAESFRADYVRRLPRIATRSGPRRGRAAGR